MKQASTHRQLPCRVLLAFGLVYLLEQSYWLGGLLLLFS